MSRILASRLIAIVVPAFTSVLASGFVGFVERTQSSRANEWTTEQRTMLRSLSLASLEPLRADPSNRFADDPRAVVLGRDLFFDTRLSGNGKVACATCHVPSQDFQDGTPLGHGVGTTGRRTMPIAGTAHGAWFFWDGRADSQWSQALGPLESAVEHGGTRTQYARVIAEHYREAYREVFGVVADVAGLPAQAGPVDDAAKRSAWEKLSPSRQQDISRVYANIGKAIAAYERTIKLEPSRFDRYVDAEFSHRQHTSGDAFTADEEAGLRIFIGKGSCSNCHNGALLSDDHFHNTGVPVASGALADSGRATGVRRALDGEFNCTSRYSDAKPEDCDELRFATTDGPELLHAFKTPSLRNVAGRAPYMDAGQFRSLEDVVEHYNAAPSAPLGHSELKPLRLSAKERAQLVAFLQTLSGPTSTPTVPRPRP
jgi:cytochrome c peroxidase